MTNQSVGVLGEELAGHFLVRRGYEILARNFTCPLGEVDLVAREAGVLVFVEVKTRRTHAMGEPAEAVTWKKRRQIVKGAWCYLKSRGEEDAPCRFDVVSVSLPPGQDPVIELVRDAFRENG